jgi:hypothetical protein
MRFLILSLIVGQCVACSGSGSPSARNTDAGRDGSAVAIFEAGSAVDSGHGVHVDAGSVLDSGRGSTDARVSDAGMDAGFGPYPAGPYGAVVGAVLTDLPLQGYVNDEGLVLSDQKPFLDAYSLQNLRETGARYALIHVSAFF